MKSPLIHIGYQKTGSTWLQREAFHPKSPVFNPLPTHDGKHTTLANAFFKDQEGYLLASTSLNQTVIQQKLNDLSSYFQGEDRMPVISHERLSGDLNSGGFDAKNIADRIYSTFPDGRIFIVFREQKDFLFSVYFQYLEEGGTQSIQQFLNTKYDERRPGFCPGYVDYFALINYYVSLFGAEQVLALPFEQFKKEPAVFMKNLSSFVGREVTVSESAFAEKHNAAKQFYAKVHWRQTTKYRTSNSLNGYSTRNRGPVKKLMNALVPALGSLVPTSLNDKTKQEVRETIALWSKGRFSESNAQLAQLINVDLKQLGYQ